MRLVAGTGTALNFYLLEPKRNTSRALWISVMAAACLGIGILDMNSAYAAEWSIEPRFLGRGSVNTNRLVTPLEHSTVGEGDVEFGAIFKRETETSFMSLHPQGRVVRYAGDTRTGAATDADLDYEAFFVNGAASKRYERLNLDFTGRYEQQATIFTELTDTLRLQVGELNRYELKPSVSYQITERDNIRVGYNHTDVSYDERVTLSDYQVNEANLNFRHLLTQRTDIFSYFYFSRFDVSPNSRDITQIETSTDNYGLQLGVEHRYNERLTLSAAGGIFYSDSTRTQSAVQIAPGVFIPATSTSDSSFGELFNASASYRGERTDYRLAYAHTLAPTGLGVLSERDDVDFSIAHRLTERLSGNLSVEYLANQFQGTGTQQSTDRIRFNAAASYQLSNWWKVSGGYTFIQIDRDAGVTDPSGTDAGGSADSHAFSITFAYSGQKWSISR
jgi:hypothetical protein